MKTRWSIERRAHVPAEPHPSAEYWDGEKWVEESTEDYTNNCAFFTEPPDAVGITGDEDARVVEWQFFDDDLMIRISLHHLGVTTRGGDGLSKNKKGES